MTDDVTDRARAALEGVTCGPWTVVSGAWGNVWHFPEGDHNDGRPTVVVRMGGMTEADSTFIATARTLVPELLAEVERLRGALERRATEWMETYEYEGGDGGGPTAYVFKACADGLRAVLRGED